MMNPAKCTLHTLRCLEIWILKRTLGKVRESVFRPGMPEQFTMAWFWWVFFFVGDDMPMAILMGISS